jgi:hypothetical protein
MIEKIGINNFIGIDKILVEELAPITVFWGQNHVGKTTIVEAIDLALTGKLPRISLKKEAHFLVRDRAKPATVAINLSGQKFAAKIDGSSIKMGQTEVAFDENHDTSHAGFRRVAFVESTLKERLSQLIKDVDMPAVLGQCRNLGADAQAIAVINAWAQKANPAPANFMDEFAQFCKSKATDARALWKSITGDVYGSDKADGWAAKVVDVSGLNALQAAATGLQDDLEREQGKRVLMLDSLTKKQELDAAMAKVDTLPRLWLKLETEQTELARLQLLPSEDKCSLVHEFAYEHARAADAYAAHEFSITENSPAMTKYLAEFGQPVANWPPERPDPKIGKAIVLINTAIANTMRDIDQCEAHRLVIEKYATSGIASLDSITSTEQTIAKIKSELNESVKLRSVLEAGKQSNLSAPEKNQQALNAHNAVCMWSKLTKSMEPGGELMSLFGASVDYFNATCGSLIVDLNDPSLSELKICEEGTLLANGIPYELHSKSMQWRIAALSSIALCTKSVLRVMCLDEFDILQNDSRNSWLRFIYKIIDQELLHQIIILATLKSEPQLPNGFMIIGLDNDA